MTKEELLKTLRDAQMDDEAIKALLNEALASLGSAEEKADEEAEKAEASKFFGVDL